MSEIVEAAQGVSEQAGALVRQARGLVVLAGVNMVLTAITLGMVMAHSLAR